MINEPNGPPSDWSPFTHKDKLAGGGGGGLKGTFGTAKSLTLDEILG